MYRKLAFAVFTISLLAGCASVPMESKEKSDMAKKFTPPSSDKAGLYIYRSGTFGGALKKDVWVDGGCLGETAPNVFFYEEVAGGIEHKVSTESEFSPNDLLLKVENGQSYFIRQYIRMGAFVGGAGIELVDREKGKEAVAKLELAKKGSCSQ
ncbi:MAG: DUF2846 domain-containing protein [Gallionella sp.]